MRYSGVVLIVSILSIVLVSIADAQPAPSPVQGRTALEKADTDGARKAAPPPERSGAVAPPGQAKALKPGTSSTRRGEEIADRARKALLLLLGAQRSSDAR